MPNERTNGPPGAWSLWRGAGLRRLALVACATVLVGGCAGPPATSTAAPPATTAPPPATAAPAPTAAPAKPTTASATAPAAIATPTAAAKPTDAPQTLTVAYSALVASQSLPWIAQEQGIFAKNGLKVDLRYINSGTQATAALLAGEADAGIVGGPSIINAVVEGGEARLIGASKNQLTGKLMARPEIQSVEDLRGKRLGANGRGSNTEFLAIQVMKRSNLQVGQDYTFVYLNANQEVAAAVAGNSAQAAVAVPPDDQRMVALGAHELVDITALKLKYPTTTVAASGKALREKQDALKRFMASLKEAVQVYKHQPDTALAVIAKYTKSDNPESLRPSYEVEGQVMSDDLKVDPDGLAVAIDDLAAEKPQIKGKQYADFVDDRFLQ